MYSALFGMGHLLLGHGAAAAISAVVFLVSGVVLLRLVGALWAK